MSSTGTFHPVATPGWRVAQSSYYPDSPRAEGPFMHEIHQLAGWLQSEHGDVFPCWWADGGMQVLREDGSGGSSHDAATVLAPGEDGPDWDDLDRQARA